MDKLTSIVNNKDYKVSSGIYNKYQFYTCYTDAVNKKTHCVDRMFSAFGKDHLGFTGCEDIYVNRAAPDFLKPTILQIKYPDHKFHKYEDIITNK